MYRHSPPPGFARHAIKALHALVAGLLLAPLGSGASAAHDISLELNELEPAHGECRVYFLIQEKAGKPLQSLKTDLIVFGKDGAIAKRLLAEIGPVRLEKTSVKIFAVAVACPEISGMLLNDVASCAPSETSEACLDRLSVSSRLSIPFCK